MEDPHHIRWIPNSPLISEDPLNRGFLCDVSSWFASARAVAYNMAMRSADSNRLMDHGILPVSKTPRTSQGKTAAVNLGLCAFKTPHSEIEQNIVALNGTPSITLFDGTGYAHYQPLRRTRALRPIPETDPLFDLLYGIRQDIESHFSTYKRQLDYDRLRTREPLVRQISPYCFAVSSQMTRNSRDRPPPPLQSMNFHVFLQ